MKESQNEVSVSQNPSVHTHAAPNATAQNVVLDKALQMPVPASVKDQQVPPPHTNENTGSGLLVIGYIIMQVVTYVFAFSNRDNIEVALAWIVVSIALSQAVSEFVTFTSVRVKKIITLAGILMPAIIALSVTYLA